MVRKLFKHEFYAYLRTLFPVWIIFSVITLIARLMQFLEVPDGFLGLPEWLLEMYTATTTILNGSAVVAYLAAAGVCAMLPLILGVIRYYKNLFTGEGYLTLTLPVTVGQHLFVKITTVLVLELFTVLLLLVSGCVLTSGSLLWEIMKALLYIFVEQFKEIGFHLPVLLIQFLVVLAVTALNELLFYQHCITLGQLFPKARLLGAVGVYFGYYMLSQVFSTVMTVVVWVAILFFAPILAMIPQIEVVFEFIAEHYLYVYHFSLALSTITTLLTALFYYVVNYLVIRKRLNLE